MAKMEINEENPNCIGCGKKNPIGLKLEFEYKMGEAKTTAVLNANYEGYKNIIHGGIISLILDETAAKAVFAMGMVGVTAKMSVRFKKPLFVGEKFQCVAKVIKNDGKRLLVEGELSVNGEVRAEAESLFIKMGVING